MTDTGSADQGRSTMVDFLRELHAGLPNGYGIELRRWQPAEKGAVYTLDELTEPDDLATAQYGHGVLPRRHGSHVIDMGQLVWCDADGTLYDPWKQVVPGPTAIVWSGRQDDRVDEDDPAKPTRTFRGFHLYWKLSTTVEPEHCVRLSVLASLAYKGDPAVLEQRRILRVPGAINPKHGPARHAEVWEEPRWHWTYDPLELEGRLVAAVIAPYFAFGGKHYTALSLGAVLFRVGWPLERALECFEYLNEMEPCDKPVEKREAIKGTYARASGGQAVSAAHLRDAMGKDDFVTLLTGLGLTARDGDLLIDDEVVGKAVHVERDIGNYVLETNDWAIADGRLVRWAKTHWKGAEESTLQANVFGTLARTHVIRQGDELEYVAKAGTARAISGIMMGRMHGDPLGDPNVWHIPMRNGTLDLRTLALEKTTKQHNHRFIVDLDYDPTATCPAWLDFLEESVPDAYTREHLQEWLGYGLMGGNPWERMLWLHGPEGTGKSTFIRAIELLLGPAYYAVTGNKIEPYSIAQLSGKKVIGCSELSPRMLQTSVLKSLVSSDPIEARHPYGRPFTFTFTGKVMWSSNELPPLDQGEGMWRRMVPVAFVTKPRRKNEKLKTELMPAQASGILNWAIVGLKRMLEVRLVEGVWEAPPASQDTVHQYRLATDTFARFVEEEVDFDPTIDSDLLEVYTRYSVWSKERGMRVEPLGPRFVQELLRFSLFTIPPGPGQRGRRMKGGRLRSYNYSGAAPMAPLVQNN